MNHFEQGMQKNDANFVPLTPLSFLDRIKDVYPDYEALIYGSRKYTWKQVYERCTRFASALTKIGVGEGDVVSVMAANTPELFEVHYSVPMTGGVVNTINTRLDVRTVAYILNHSDCKVFIVDRQFHNVAIDAIAQVNREIIVIDIDDKQAGLGDIPSIGKLEYESFLQTGDVGFEWIRPDDEWQAISLNYTSGTTGNPKGVVYHHRGSYLMSMGSITAWNMPNRLTYLYTVPMFHCNGWGYPWTLAMLHARVIFIRNIVVKEIFELIDEYEVTHFGGAPIVLNMITSAPEKDRKKLTSARFLELYKKLLVPGGTIHLKTDSPELFEFTLEQIELHNLTKLKQMDDVYGNPSSPEELVDIQTYYEGLHIKKGRTIRYVQFSLDKYGKAD